MAVADCDRPRLQRTGRRSFPVSAVENESRRQFEFVVAVCRDTHNSWKAKSSGLTEFKLKIGTGICWPTDWRNSRIVNCDYGRTSYLAPGPYRFTKAVVTCSWSVKLVQAIVDSRKITTIVDDVIERRRDSCQRRNIRPPCDRWLVTAAVRLLPV